MSAYVYPGTKNEFYSEFGGYPNKEFKPLNVFIIFIVIILIIVILTAIAFLLTRTKTVVTDRNTLFNLEELIDVNNANTECCVFPGGSAPNQEYIYDIVNNITYSRQKPASIDLACSTFPNPTVCIADNTDSDGNIIPRVTFAAKPYYTFENGLFVGCPTTTTC